MKRLSSIAYPTLAIAGTLLLASCATGSRLSSSWVDPGYRAGPLTKIAVFSMSDKDAVRRAAETAMAQALSAGGTEAVPGFTLFPGKVDPSQKDAIRARLVRQGFDGALVSRVVSVDKSQSYVPPQTYVTPSPIMASPPYRYYSTFPAYYGYAYQQTYTPGYVYESTTAVVESMLFSLQDDKPIWTGVSESFDPRSVQEAIGDVVRVVSADLKAKKLVRGATG